MTDQEKQVPRQFLTLKKPLSNLIMDIATDINQHKKNAQQEEEKRQSRQRTQDTLTWLCKTFPKCFNPKRPLPLKRGVEKDIFTYLSQNPQISKTQVKAALAFYTRNLRYQKAICVYKHRFDLTGKIFEKIIEDDKNYASQRVAWIEEKLKHTKRISKHK